MATSRGSSKACNLREPLDQGLEDLVDIYLASATMERVRKGEEALYSSSDVRGELGLDH
jgi:RHH-type rel operon transcriptional repressor/antitoxin RelB